LKLEQEGPEWPILAPEPEPEPAPVCKTHILRLKVTACSPDDPRDSEYYRKHGYEGAIYNIAAYTKRFPKGTLMRVPGYMEKTKPEGFWEVDSSGGSIIRRSARRGVDQVDVKFRTYKSAAEWGAKWLDVEVIYPADYAAWQAAMQQYLRNK
jgi:hypothetical protein